MFTQLPAARLDSTLLWYAVIAATVIIIIVSVAYTILLMSQNYWIKRGLRIEEIQQRFLKHKPYGIPANLLVSGASLSIIAYLTQLVNPRIPDGVVMQTTLIPFLVSILGAIAVTLSIRGLHTLLRDHAKRNTL